MSYSTVTAAVLAVLTVAVMTREVRRRAKGLRHGAIQIYDRQLADDPAFLEELADAIQRSYARKHAGRVG